MCDDLDTARPPGLRVIEENTVSPARLVRPNRLGYVLIAAEIERPHLLRRHGAHRRRLQERVVTATRALVEIDEVIRVDVFDALLLPPGAEEGYTRLSASGSSVRPARFDLVVLVECESVDGAARVREHEATAAVLELLSSVRQLHCTVMRNARRIAEVDKSRGGVFLFNYFFRPSTDREGDAGEITRAVWEHTAGWFTSRANLDNSTLFAPVQAGATDYTVINHCRWDGLLDIVPHLVFRPSLRRFVLGTFDANDVIAMPVLYRLAGSNGAPRRRPLAGRLLMGLGILHGLATLPLVLEVLPRVRAGGVFGGIARDMPPPADAMPAVAALFSTVTAVLLLVAGALLLRLQQASHRVPGWLGPVLLLTGLGGGLLLPVSGFWLVALLGCWLVLRRAKPA